MNRLHLLLVIVIDCVIISPTLSNVHRFECAACTIGIGTVLQLAQVHNSSAAEVLSTLCDLFDSHQSYHDNCEKLVKFSTPFIVDLLYRRLNPDVICTSLDLCSSDASGQPKCHLFPQHQDEAREMKVARALVRNSLRSQAVLRELPPLCQWPGMKLVCQRIESFSGIHLPILDIDGDGFSATETLRGYAWKGKDCDDLSSSRYPGTRPQNDDIEFDSNCNGIFGVNLKTGRPYESELCEGSNPIGIMLLGDSAGAHFHIPEQYFRADYLTRGTLSHLPYVVENEFDWPMLSAVTGYRNITWSIIDGFTQSVYNFLRQRNLCNHRDFQNLGVNGADSGSFLSYWESFRRNQTRDYPVLAILEFVGNDVCNSHVDTLAHMTTPEEMRRNTLQVLDKLNSTLPHGSHVLMIGLADARYLWGSLNRRFHPFGALNKDIDYPAFYSFLSCNGLNPCNGWLTANETVRNLTSLRAYELSRVLSNIAEEFRNHYKNFDLAYLDCPFDKIVYEWQKKYGPDSAWQLIEPVDGFHPSKKANNLFAEYLWTYILKNLSHFVGNVNPKNQQIADIFGDQGGHF